MRLNIQHATPSCNSYQNQIGQWPFNCHCTASSSYFLLGTIDFMEMGKIQRENVLVHNERRLYARESSQDLFIPPLFPSLQSSWPRLKILVSIFGISKKNQKHGDSEFAQIGTRVMGFFVRLLAYILALPTPLLAPHCLPSSQTQLGLIFCLLAHKQLGEIEFRRLHFRVF